MRLILSSLFVFLASHAFAQTYFLNGTATDLGNDCYRLTTEATNQNGAVWYADQIDLTQPFDLQFSMNFGDIDPNGADGIMFVLQTVGTNALGQSGGGLGFLGFLPSFGIEFDTWWNQDYADLTSDHIAMVSNGVVDHNSPNSLAGPVQASSTSINIEDGLDHTVRIVWNPLQQEMVVYFDCDLRLAHTVNLIADIFNGQSSVYWGFTAGTGGSFNNQIVCLSEDILSPVQAVTTCPNGAITLDAGGDPTGTYLWEPADFLDDPTSATPVCTPPSDISYTVTFTDLCGFNTVQTIEVSVVEMTASIAGLAYINCADPTTVMSGGNNFGNPAVYEWTGDPAMFGGVTNNAICTIVGGGDLTLTVTYNQVCEATTTVFIDSDFSPIDVEAISSGDITCYDPTAELIATVDVSGATIQWSSPNGIFGSPTNAAETIADAPGTYNVLVTHPTSGCTDADQVIVANMVYYPEITMGVPDTLTCKNPVVSIEGTAVTPENSILEWTTITGTLIDGTSTLEPMFADTGFYFLTATIPENGCVSNSEVFVPADENIFIDVTSLVFPNVFSPNNDGINDKFHPYLLEEPELDLTQFMGHYQLSVYNRWGAQVFDSNSLPVDWDGKNNGEVLTDGVYYYIVEYEIVCDGLGRLYNKGEFQVLK